MAFDVERFVQTGGRIHWDDLDLAAAFRESPLDADTLRCLQYMHDIESHTVCYLRDILVTGAHADPSVTTFLTQWNYEEHWHGSAIGEVLAAHGRPGGGDRVRAVRRQIRKSDRWRPMAFMAADALFHDVVPVHMTWGAINEFTTQAAYGLLARKAEHPVLAELLKRIMRQEGRHIDFYFSEGKRRLGASTTAQRITRLALKRFWRPVGHGVRPVAETNFVIRHLFASEDGKVAAQRIDRQVDRLPGLAGLQLVSGATRRAVAAAA
jgi:hypothetical protein